MFLSHYHVKIFSLLSCSGLSGSLGRYAMFIHHSTQTRPFEFCIVSLLYRKFHVFPFMFVARPDLRLSVLSPFLWQKLARPFLFFPFCLYLSIYLATPSLFQDCMYVIGYTI